MKRLIYILLLFLSVSSQAQIIRANQFYKAQVVAGGSYGSELMVNSTFNSNITGWDRWPETGWAWQTDGSGGGWARHTAGDAEIFYQSINPLTVGKTYHVVFTIGGMTAGEVYATCGTTGEGTHRTGNGTYTEDLVCSGSDGRFKFDLNGTTFNGYIDNVSVKEVL
jgi:hypothetical protein